MDKGPHASSGDKNGHKQIRLLLAEKQKEDFVRHLPMSRDEFHELFNFLDTNLNHCDHSLKLTTDFLHQNEREGIEKIAAWLAEHGGYCDCEVLANVEEQFR